MNIAEMVVLGEIDLIVRFPPNGDFVFLGDDKAIVDVGALDDFESYDSLFGNLHLKLI